MVEHVRHKILLVDDEAYVLQALNRTLRKSPWEIVTCDCPTNALSMLSKHQFSVILSDFNMPNMSGVDFLKQAKATQPDAIPVIISGFSDFDGLMDIINECGIFKYLMKPWNNEFLMSQIEECIKTYELKLENTQLLNEVQVSNGKLAEANRKLESLFLEQKQINEIKDNILISSQYMIDKLPIGIMTFDSDYRVSNVNEAAAVALDIVPDCFVGVALKDMFPESFCKQLLDLSLIDKEIKTLEFNGKQLKVTELMDPLGLPGFLIYIVNCN